MSEDAISAADLGDAGSRGERRRALRAERERQAQREQPQDPPQTRPYLVTLQGQEAAVLVADAPDASTGEAGSNEAAAGDARSVPPSASAERPAEHPVDADEPSLFSPGAGAPSLVTAEAGAPSPFTDGADQRAPIAGRDVPSTPGADQDVPLPPARQPRAGALPFDLPPFALPSDPQPSEWSAFTPVIPPEPLAFDERRPTAWAPRETWTSPGTAPSDSWMALSPSPSEEAVEPGDEVPARAAAVESAWTVPTPENGVPAEPRESVDEWSPEPAAGNTNGPDGAGEALVDTEDVVPRSPRPGWSADLSRVGLFRSALEDLAQGPGDATSERPSHEPAADERPPDEAPGRELPADESPAQELPADELPAHENQVETRAEELPAAEESWDEEPFISATADESSTGELSAGDLSTSGLSSAEASTDELPATRFGVPASSDESAGNERQRNELSWDELSPADEFPSDELPSEDWPSDEEARRGELADAQLPDGERPQAFADGDGDGEVAPESVAQPTAEPLAERPDSRPPDDDETPDGPLPVLGLPPVAAAPASSPPPPPSAPPRPDDAHLPPLGRQAFGRAPAQRFAEAIAHGEGPHPSEDDEPVRGTVAPVLRRSTERVRYPTSTMPVIRPPVMPPTPGAGIPIAPSRARPVSWQQALAGDVVPAKKKKQPRRARVSKPRHESGGVGEYRPKVAADRSLTLLVVAMLLVLAGLVAAAVWTFWPSVSGNARSLPPSGAPRAVGGP